VWRSVLNAWFSFGGGPRGDVSGLRDNFGLLGFLMIGVFAASWEVSVLVYQARGYESSMCLRPDRLPWDRDAWPRPSPA
jgi:hypothetical protein